MAVMIGNKYARLTAVSGGTIMVSSRWRTLTPRVVNKSPKQKGMGDEGE